MNKKELAKLIRSFVDGSCDKWDWDDFISVRQHNKELEQIRQRLLDIPKKYPPHETTGWCSGKGIRELIEIADNLSPDP